MTSSFFLKKELERLMIKVLDTEKEKKLVSIINDLSNNDEYEFLFETFINFFYIDSTNIYNIIEEDEEYFTIKNSIILFQTAIKDLYKKGKKNEKYIEIKKRFQKYFLDTYEKYLFLIIEESDIFYYLVDNKLFMNYLLLNVFFINYDIKFIERLIDIMLFDYNLSHLNKISNDNYSLLDSLVDKNIDYSNDNEIYETEDLFPADPLYEGTNESMERDIIDYEKEKWESLSWITETYKDTIKRTLLISIGDELAHFINIDTFKDINNSKDMKKIIRKFFTFEYIHLLLNDKFDESEVILKKIYDEDFDHFFFELLLKSDITLEQVYYILNSFFDYHNIELSIKFKLLSKVIFQKSTTTDSKKLIIKYLLFICKMLNNEENFYNLFIASSNQDDTKNEIIKFINEIIRIISYKENLTSTSLIGEYPIIIKLKKLFNFVINIDGFFSNTIDLTEYFQNFINDIRQGVISFYIKYMDNDRIKNIELVRFEEQERLNKKLQNIIQQYTHTLANTIFPNTIYEVAQKLKKHTEYKKDAMVLADAYHAEVFIQHQGQLLAIRNTNNEKTFQSYIRGDRLEKDTQEKYVTIYDIIKKSAERVLSRFFNEDYHKLDKIRKILSQKHNISFNEWKNKFEKEVFFEEKDIIDWANNNFAKIKISLTKKWEQIKLKRDKYAESLLQGYSSELLFNAVKYRDLSSEYWVKIEFNEKTVDDVVYLTSIWKNRYIKDKNESISTERGLRAIKNDLEMLNETEKEEKTLEISPTDDFFAIKLTFKSDLFILPPKQKIKIDNLFK